MGSAREDYEQLLADHRVFTQPVEGYFEAFLHYKELFYTHRGSPERARVLEALMRYYNTLDLSSSLFYSIAEIENVQADIMTKRTEVNYALEAERQTILARLGMDDDAISIMNMWAPAASL